MRCSYPAHKIPINNNEWLDSWLIKSSVTNTKGIVILFHGKIGTKSSLLDAAKVFNDLGYDTLTIDFRGAGTSSGNKSTIGVEEAEDVVAAVNYLKQLNLNKPVILYGISMGSAAILRAISKHNIQPDAIILELPFTTLLKAVKIRLKNESLPPSPMAELIVFWGSIQHGFNGFAHKPREYAKDVKCPTLILAGKRDRTMPITEVKKLYQNLDVPKNMVIFPQAGHQVLSRSHSKLWTQAIKPTFRTSKCNIK
ncbi:Lysophospholipase (fragment) [Hyella patelloides LEGE 07179]|uniref:Lysophospholipase n=1 Tax=Hyella patelloides LEGE 07179 TaxID=945734 RepID=A0A563W3A8_9CYAN